MPSVKDIYKFDELTWPEINEAVTMAKESLRLPPRQQ